MAKIITWSDEYNLGIKIIDDQHREFVEIIDELYTSLQNVSSKPDLEKILEKLVNYKNIHFSTEEKYFKEFNYEGAVEHETQHRMFNEKITEFQKKSQEGTYNIGFDLIDYLEDWLVDHLANMDKKYVACFHEHGLT